MKRPIEMRSTVGFIIKIHILPSSFTTA